MSSLPTSISISVASPSPSSSRPLEACPPKKKHKRNRQIHSCNPCRSSKLKCDRARPACSGCDKKNIKCTYSTALHDIGEKELEEAEVGAPKDSRGHVEHLEGEVERLQKLVNVLVDARIEHMNEPIASSSLTASISIVPEYPLTRPDAQDEQEDLVEKLFGLTISSFSTTATIEPVPYHETLVDEAQRLLEPLPRPRSRPATSTSFHFLRNPIPSMPNMLAIPLYVYNRHRDAVYASSRSDEPPDPISLAIVFAVLGIGLHSRYTYTALGGSKEQLEQARTFVEYASVVSLLHSRFLSEPTIDAVRALSLLSIFHLSIAPGDEGSIGIALTGLTVQTCLQMNLHRDPFEAKKELGLAGLFSWTAAEEQRSLLHHVYLLDGICTASYHRNYILLHAHQISTCFPLDLNDTELERLDRNGLPPRLTSSEGPSPSSTNQETVMTSLIERFKLFRFSERVSEHLFSSATANAKSHYRRTLELDEQLDHLSDAIPLMYQWTHLTALRIDNADDELRAWRISIIWVPSIGPLLPSANGGLYEPSKQACIDAAKGLLAVHACPANLIPAAGFTNKASLACIILCLAIIFDVAPTQESTSPSSPYFADTIRDPPPSLSLLAYRPMVEAAVARLEKFATISVIARRSVKIIRFLLDKIDARSLPFLVENRFDSISVASVSNISLDLPETPQTLVHDPIDLANTSLFSSSPDTLTSLNSSPALALAASANPAAPTNNLDLFDFLDVADPTQAAPSSAPASFSSPTSFDFTVDPSLQDPEANLLKTFLKSSFCA
ncbi:uncharacterized protein JCM15063_000525 [Sporobolomyces koalae]|uniref:uncharacterized protein n=1 Tax=Sporobolomyces koalae TaxID=500713 RepID=UPI0031701401